MSSSTNLWVLLSLGLAGVLLMSRRLRRPTKKDLGAFVDRFELLPPPQPAPPKAPHPLRGLSFAVADILDIMGYVTGFGNQDWARTHEPAVRASLVVSILIDEGATCVGKTVIDEFAYTISGENRYFGMPTNPAAPERIPGGCSSGSAVAVASGLVDFSLGVDTNGGVRVPAGFCGILGFRPSHGAISNIGVIPVSPSLDTIGWFAKDPSVLHRVGHVLLQLPSDTRQPRHIIIADDCFQLLKIPSSRVTQVVIKSAEKLFGRQLINRVNLGDYLTSKVSSLKQLQNGTGKGNMGISKLMSLAGSMRLLQRHEFQTNHGEWIKSVKPNLDPCISANISEAGNTSIDVCQSARNETRLAINTLLKDDGILVLPTVLGPPPKLNNSKEYLSEDYQIRSLSLSAIGSMSGCCQVTIPLGFHEKCPVSVSFIARHGGDRLLLNTVQAMYASLQEQAEIAMKLNISSSSISKEEAAELAKEKGNISFKDKQWQKAISLYTEAIKLSGKNATYYSNRAAAHLEVGGFLQAEADCTTAISLDKKNVKAYLRRGTARELLGYFKEAMEDFKYALVLEPTNKTATLASSRLRKFVQ